MPGSTPIDDLEAAYLAARDAFGHLLVERTRGHEVAALETTYAGRRRDVDRLLVGIRPAPDEEALVRAIRGTLSWFDEYEAIDDGGTATADAAGTAGPETEPAEIAALRRATMTAYGEAGDAIRVGDEVLHRLAAFDRLAIEPDEGRRRQVFEAMAPVWQAVDGDGGPDSPYRRLLRSSAARWAREGSPIERNAAAVGMDPATLVASLEALLGAWREVVGPGTVEPWSHRHRTGSLARRLADAVPLDRLQEINDAHLASLGAAPAGLGIRYDIVPRPGRPIAPFAFTIADRVPRRLADGTWQPTAPWVFATYTTGGLGNLNELLHESGHAIHYAAIRERPAFFEPLVDDGGFVEGIGELVGWDADEPAFLARHLGAEAGLRESRLGRYGPLMLDVCWTLFEIELHRHPDRVPNEVWSEITERGLGIAPHPEWSWWAVRAQLIDAPGYLANYVLAGLVAAALRARIRAIRGDWLAGDGDPGWYGFVSERLLRFGAGRPAGRVLTDLLDGPLTAEPLLADLALAAGA